MEFKDFWPATIIIVLFTSVISYALGGAYQAKDILLNYSLGYAECKAGMAHKYQDK